MSANVAEKTVLASFAPGVSRTRARSIINTIGLHRSATTGTIADAVRETRSRVTNHLNKMEKLGFVSKAWSRPHGQMLWSLRSPPPLTLVPDNELPRAEIVGRIDKALANIAQSIVAIRNDNPNLGTVSIRMSPNGKIEASYTLTVEERHDIEWD